MPAPDCWRFEERSLRGACSANHCLGIGLCGSVSAACLAKAGHDVVGVEPNATKVNSLNAGTAFIKEPGLAELAAEMVRQGDCAPCRMARSS